MRTRRPVGRAKGGGLHVHYGTGSDGDGSFGFRRQTLNQDTVGVPGVAESGDRFGAALAVADLDGDDRDGLVAGAPVEAIGTRTAAGAATVLFGAEDGLADASGDGHAVAYNQVTPRVAGRRRRETPSAPLRRRRRDRRP